MLKLKIAAFSFSFLLILTVLKTNMVVAQPSYDPPSGVWCSCPPSTGNGEGSVMTKVAEKDYVKGILVRAVWQHIEPEKGQYNWQIIDDQITRAKAYNKKIALAVGGGPNSPQWLYNLGADSIKYTLPFEGKIPVPWDTIFLKEWTHFIQELGNRYQNDTTIQLVYITNSSSNGFEMQLPFKPEKPYNEIGYSDQKVIDSWKSLMRTYHQSFPHHYLTSDFHPVNNSNDVADSVYAFAVNLMGNQYGANAWWWTQKNTTVYPQQFEILKSSTQTQLFSGIQMAASGTKEPDRFGEGGLPKAFQLAIENKVCYWEVWNNDIIDGSFDSLFIHTQCNNQISNIIPLKTQNHIQLYPNPSQGFLNIDSPQEIDKILIKTLNGTLIESASFYNQQPETLNLTSRENGIYLIEFWNQNQRITTKKVVLIK